MTLAAAGRFLLLLLGSLAPCCLATSDTDLVFTTVFAADVNLSSCYRIPLITQTAAGTLLAISEERYSSILQPSSDSSACPDQYGTGHGGHNQVLRRSTDMGKTWGPIIRLVARWQPAELASGGRD